jgi:anti-anti-sigma factor
VVKLSGELDVASVPQLQAFVKLLGPASAQNVLLELDELTFCDSSGIRP